MMEGENCESCRFWKVGDYPHDGQCRAHAPRVFVLRNPGETADFETAFPVTSRNAWCGEFVKKEN